MSRDKTRSLMRRLVVLKWIADFEPEGFTVDHEQGWQVTREVLRLEKVGLIYRCRTRAVPKRSPLFRTMRSRAGGAPARMTNVRITPAGRDLLARRYRPEEAEALLSGGLRCTEQGWWRERCSWLCRIAQRRRHEQLHGRPGGIAPPAAQPKGAKGRGASRRGAISAGCVAL